MENEEIMVDLSESELEEIAGGAAHKFTIDYTVVPGDNLTKIAKRFGCTWQEIYALNRNKIKDKNLIKPGWVLKVPTDS